MRNESEEQTAIKINHVYKVVYIYIALFSILLYRKNEKGSDKSAKWVTQLSSSLTPDPVIKQDLTLQSNQTGAGSIANPQLPAKSQMKMTLAR